MGSIDDVLAYTLETLRDYTNQSAHKIVDLLLINGFATKSEEEKPDKIFIGKMTDKTGLSFCISKNNSAIKSIEKWEYDKNYRYSMLFDVKDFDENVFKMPIASKQIVCYDDLTEYEELYAVAMNPSLLQIDDNFCLKFNFKLDATDAIGEKLKKRYAILAIFYTKEQLLEIRFDTLEISFERNRFKYVYDVIAWIRRYLGLSVSAIDLREVTDYIKRNGKDDGIIVSGQDMLMASGGKATVEIGNDNSMVLPFIGELKIIMKEYDEEFNRVPDLKLVFEDFIYEKENLSDFPWLRFKFEEKVIEVKFTFDYGKEHGCLLQHYHSPLRANQGRERMDYVTEYIIKVRDIIAGLPPEQR